MLRNIADGFQSVLGACYYAPMRETDFGARCLDALFFDVDSSAQPDGQRKLYIGLAIYKGIEVPIEFYQVSAVKLEDGECAVIVLIEDALTRHDNPSSTYQKFKAGYSGPILVGKRFLFINGSNGHQDQFGEDFFVSLLDTEIDGAKARDLFERVRFKNCIAQAVSESVYCPTEHERQLILRLLGTGNSFNLSELRALDASFDWATKEKLNALSDFIDKRGSKYSRRALEDIKPIKHLLKTLSENTEGISQADLENQVRHTWILTGIPEATKLFPTWCLTLIENQGLLKREGALVCFRDTEKEVSDFFQACKNQTKEIDETIQEYKRGFAPERTQHVEMALADLNQRLQVAPERELTERGNLLKACEADARSLMVSLVAIPELVRTDLEKELAHVAELLVALKEKAKWHYPDLDNPSLHRSRAMEGQLTPVKAMIKVPVPFEIETRKNIERMRLEIEVHLEELSKPAPDNIEAPGADMSIDQAAFFIFSAIRANRNGQVKVEYAEMLNGEVSAQNEKVDL